MTTLDSFINPSSKKEEVKKVITDVSKESIPKKERPKPILPWTQTYLPKNLDEFIGTNHVKNKIKSFLDNFENEKKKALLLWGPNGVGKSCIAKTLSEELNYELVEFNASDKRNKEVIETQLGNVLTQRSLFGTEKLVLIDDLDGVSGKKDRGGASAIAKLIQTTKFPIIITCLDPYVDKVKPVRSKCQLIELKEISQDEITSKLKFILDSEKIKYKDSDLETIARNSKGDLRAAINDSQMLTIGKKELDVSMLKELESRLETTDMKDAIKLVLKSTNAKETLGAFDRLSNGDLDKAALWLDYNMPFEYLNKIDRAKAYGCLTKADVFKSRIMKRQHWRFLVYINTLLTAGIAISKSKPYEKEVPYKESSRILKLWQANMKYGKRKTIAEKIASHIHTSQKRVIQDFEFYAKIIINKPELSEELGLDSDELNFCKKILST